jgi:hypothetical protein
MFRKLDLFPSSDEGGGDMYSVGFVIKWLAVSKGQWIKFKNPVILSVIYHRQNRLESTC